MNLRLIANQARGLTSTDELIEHYAANTDLPRALLAEAIPLAIDAVYANRDGGGNMHSCGAELAVLVLTLAEIPAAATSVLRDALAGYRESAEEEAGQGEEMAQRAVEACDLLEQRLQQMGWL